MKILKFALPLIVFSAIVIFLALGLKLNPRLVPSPLIDKQAPNINLPVLNQQGNYFQNSQMLGKVWLLNVWASWCAACKIEHPLLLEMAKEGAIIVGLDYKDQQADAIKWLQDYQNPYQIVIVDEQGETGIDWGVYGVPETFLIDKVGKIRHKHIGPLDADEARYILKLVTQLQQQS